MVAEPERRGEGAHGDTAGEGGGQSTFNKEN